MPFTRNKLVRLLFPRSLGRERVGRHSCFTVLIFANTENRSRSPGANQPGCVPPDVRTGVAPPPTPPPLLSLNPTLFSQTTRQCSLDDLMPNTIFEEGSEGLYSLFPLSCLERSESPFRPSPDTAPKGPHPASTCDHYVFRHGGGHRLR